MEVDGGIGSSLFTYSLSEVLPNVELLDLMKQ